MRIAHISDWHGNLRPIVGRCDVVVSSGDLLPDAPSQYKDVAGYRQFQAEWIQSHIEDFKTMLDGRDFLFVGGNHDHILAEEMEQILNTSGIKAIPLANKLVTYQGANFYGFPYVNWINGEFNYECRTPEMSEHVERMASAVNQAYIDVIVAHSPLFGCLDLDYKQNNRFGNRTLANALDYSWDKDMLPDYYLCGHVHYPAITTRSGMLVSNAACSQHIIEV